jgi:FG-GAP-like repeat
MVEFPKGLMEQRMIRCRSVLVTLAGAVLSVAVMPPRAAQAAISFVPAEAITAPVDPDHIVMADLNHDGRSDAIVVSKRSHTLSVLLGDSNSSSRFNPATVVNFGDDLRRPAAGDLNGDGNVDVAVPDDGAKGVWILLGMGNGTFLQPYLVQVGRSPFAVAIANFDGVRNADLAVADAKQDRMFIRLNDGQTPPQFPNGPDFQIGDEPTAIVAADFNRDGHPDLAALNTGGPRGKDIGVLIFDRLAAGFPVFQPVRNYIAAANPLDLLNAADLNNDGIPDLVLLDKPATNNNRLIVVLLSRGDGVFLSPTNFELVCPFFTGGLVCDATGFTTADFDGNGNVDLAILLKDPRRFSTTDALQVYAGRGDGGFGGGNVFSVGKKPIAVGAGDLNGDGPIDLVVAAKRDLTVQVAFQAFINVSTPGQAPNGTQCILGDACLSGRCTNGRCCATACFDFEQCNVPGSEGVCVPVVEPIDCTADVDCPGICRSEPSRLCEGGGDCNTGDNCRPRACRDGFCCDPACDPFTDRCNVPDFEGLCIPKSEIGTACTEDEDCVTSLCRDGFCCNTECVNGVCNTPGQEGICQAKLPLGEFCGDGSGEPDDSVCASGICDFFDLICCDKACTADEFCSEDGFCTPFETGATPTPTGTLNPMNTPGTPGDATPTPTQVPSGGFCDTGSECNSTFCVNEICCLLPSCDADHHCEQGTGACVEGTPPPTRTRTPTLHATSTPQTQCPDGFEPVGGDCVAVSRNGGCSTNENGGGGGSLLMVMLLPLALVGRRWQLRRAAVPVRRERQ